jgi:hypothetical protein
MYSATGKKPASTPDPTFADIEAAPVGLAAAGAAPCDAVVAGALATVLDAASSSESPESGEVPLAQVILL